MTDNSEGTLPPATPQAQSKTGLSLTILLALWLVGVTLAAQGIGWLVEQIAIATGSQWPWWGWLAITMGQAFLNLLPLVPVVWLWRKSAYKAIFRGWLAAVLFTLFMIPGRLLPLPDLQRTLLWQIGGTCLFGGLLFLYIAYQQRRSNQAAAEDDSTTPNVRWGWLALILAPLLLYPWLAWGALGSWLDTVLALIFGLSIGWVAVLLLRLQVSQVTNIDSAAPGVGVNGFAAGITLLILSSSLGSQGAQLLLILMLPALGWLLIALNPTTPNSKAPPLRHDLARIILLGAVAAAPFLLIDVAELVLILNLGSRDILPWALAAAGVTMLLGWLLGLVVSLWRRNDRPPPNVTVLAASTLVIWLLGGLIYISIGQPGFHGDRLFVILNEQADLSEATAMPDIAARREYVYTTLVSHAERSQQDLRSTLDRRNIAYTPYYLVNALDVEGGPFLRRWLENQPQVERVLANPILRPLPAPIPVAAGSAPAPTEPQWNLTLIGADRVWAEFGVTGAGVVIGQSDSGMDWQHPELQSSYRGGPNQHDYHWYDPWYGTAAPTDIGGHGTHTLGSVVGQTVGVAPGATWFGCSNLARNLGNPALYLDCMQFMLAPFPQGGDPFSDGDPGRSADVLNNSWGCPPIEGCDARALLTATEALRAAGIFVVVSAGNDGPACGTINSPLALYDAAFSVGAVDQQGELASFSSRGPVTVDGSQRSKPDIVAPGVHILSAFPNDTYQFTDGTSMAGPHVVGVVALVWSVNPNLIGQIEQTEAILQETAAPYTGALPDCGPAANAVGYGLVDAYAAVQMAREDR